MTKKGLGKGLLALIPEQAIPEQGTKESVRNILLQEIFPNPRQPRRNFDEEKLAELAASIRQHGVVQPVIVVESDKGYELVAGERRWRAAQLAGLDELPCIIRELTHTAKEELALIENIQREDLNAMEEAQSYHHLMEAYAYTQEDLAGRLGKSRSYIANTLRLLSLEEKYQELIAKGRLTAGHGRALLAVEQAKNREVLARDIMDKKLSVRQAEELAKKLNSQKTSGKQVKKNKADDTDLRELESQLRERFCTKVSICPAAKGGKIIVDYYSQEELMRLADVLLKEE